MNGPFADQQKEDEEGNIQLEKIASEVKVMKIGEGDSQKAILEKSVIFSSSKSADVVAESSGRIKQVKFNVGDKVKKGQVLAYFDQSGAKNSAKVSYQAAQGNLAVAYDNLERTKEMVDESLELAKNARKIAEIQLKKAKDNRDEDNTKANRRAVDLAKRTLENAEDAEDQAKESVKLQVNGAQMTVNQLQEGVNQARIAYETTIVKAPISGVVTSKNIKVDDYLSRDMVVAQIVGEGKLEAVISLNVNQAKRVKDGQKVKILVDKNEFEGEVASGASIASRSNQRFELRISSKEDLSQYANKSGKVVLELGLIGGDSRNIYFVPMEAVNMGQIKTTVFVIKDGKASVKEVEVGEIIGDQIEVLTGLDEGDLLVVENGRSLNDGDEVKILE